MSHGRLPPLRLFAVFQAVLRSGSFQRAATELNVSQPAVSQAIRMLEEHIGVRLLDRGSKPITQTPAGRILHRAVEEGLGCIADAIEEVQALQRSAANSVTIACSVGTATYWLMPRLTGFYACHGDITVNVMTAAHSVPNLTPGVDLVIRYGMGNWSDGRVMPLFEESVVPVCSPQLLQAMQDRGERLDAMPLLHVQSGDLDWLTWADYLRAIGHAPVRSQGRVFTNYVQATQAALDGQGVMLGWQSNAGILVEEGRLVQMPYPPFTPPEAFFLVVAERYKAIPAVDLLVNWLTCSNDILRP